MSASPETARANGAKGGRPKGRKNRATLQREAVLNAMKQRIMYLTDPLLNAAVAAAVGTHFLFKIETETVGGRKQKSKPILVEDPDEIRDYIDRLERGDEADSEKDPDIYYYMTTKDPNVQAFKELRDTAFGKPKDSVEVTHKMPTPLLHALRHNNSNGKD